MEPGFLIATNAIIEYLGQLFPSHSEQWLDQQIKKKNYTASLLPKRFGLRPIFLREYILNSKWSGNSNHFVVGIAGDL